MTSGRDEGRKRVGDEVFADSRASAAPLPSVADIAAGPLFTHSLDGVFLSTLNDRILRANAACCRLFGMTEEELGRRGYAGIADRNDRRWLTAFNEQERTGRFAGQLSVRRANGETFDAQMSTTLCASDDGELRITLVRRVLVDGEPARRELQPPMEERSDVCDRLTFVQTAEQQRRVALRDHLSISLVYMRLGQRVDLDDPIVPPSDALRDAFIAILNNVARWGDVTGQVADDDFAMLSRDEHRGLLSALLRQIHSGVDHFNHVTDGPALHVHIGTTNIEAGSHEPMVELLDRAAHRMIEHTVWERLFERPTAHCSFSLERPFIREPALVGPAHTDGRLTERELGVLRLLATPRTYRDIADELFISTNTVKTHVGRVYAKLGASGRTDALAKARTAGIALAVDAGPAPGRGVSPDRVRAR